jgi:Cu(I)/Ag(I) efflux system membrane fusion protein
MKKTLFAAAVIAAFTFSSCSESSTENTASTTEQQEGMAQGDMNAEETTASLVVETPEFSSVAAPMKAQISELVGEYMKLKDALVASDAAAAKAAANQVLTVANAMPVATLTTDEKTYAEEKRDQVVNSATKIAGAANLDAQRENLEQLSEAVFSMAKAFDAASETLYYQHCPMALNDQGAYWLSSNEEIRNPYFGDKMLKCGSNEEVYKN